MDIDHNSCFDYPEIATCFVYLSLVGTSSSTDWLFYIDARTSVTAGINEVYLLSSEVNWRHQDIVF